MLLLPFGCQTEHPAAYTWTCTPSLLPQHQGLPLPEAASSSGSSSRPKLTFRLYFPQPPYRGAKYAAALSKVHCAPLCRHCLAPECALHSVAASSPVLSPAVELRGAARPPSPLLQADKLFNFVGLVLGHHGKTIQRIQKASGARVEVHDSGGNLNGEHPAHDDPSLHALVLADSRAKLDKAVALLLEVLAPTNTEYRPIKVGRYSWKEWERGGCERRSRCMARTLCPRRRLMCHASPCLPGRARRLCAPAPRHSA